VLMLVARLDVRIVSEDGELLRMLTLDPARRATSPSARD